MLRIASMLRQFFVVLKKQNCVSFVCMCVPKHGITLLLLAHMCNTHKTISQAESQRDSRVCAEGRKKNGVIVQVPQRQNTPHFPII